MRLYGKYDVWKTDNGARYEYLSGTDTLCYFESNRPVSEEALPEMRVTELAESYLSEIISPDKIHNYVRQEVDVDPNIFGRNAVLYYRELYGYKTDDTISICFDQDGQVCYMNAYNLHRFDSLEDQLTEELIQNAESYLINSLENAGFNDLTIYPPSIIIVNDEGKPFLKKYASVGKDPAADSEYGAYYVNILDP